MVAVLYNDVWTGGLVIPSPRDRDRYVNPSLLTPRIGHIRHLIIAIVIELVATRNYTDDDDNGGDGRETEGHVRDN